MGNDIETSRRERNTQLTYLVSYLDGSVKQKQTQNTTNLLTAQWTKNANFLKSMLLNNLKTKLIGQHNGRKTPIHEILQAARYNGAGMVIGLQN